MQDALVVPDCDSCLPLECKHDACSGAFYAPPSSPDPGQPFNVAHYKSSFSSCQELVVFFIEYPCLGTVLRTVFLEA